MIGLIFLAVLMVAGAGRWAAWRWHQRRLAMSDRWLMAEELRESRSGVDLPRWRFPAEMDELKRRERVARLNDARSRQRGAKSA